MFAGESLRFRKHVCTKLINKAILIRHKDSLVASLVTYSLALLSLVSNVFETA